MKEAYNKTKSKDDININEFPNINEIKRDQNLEIRNQRDNQNNIIPLKIFENIIQNYGNKSYLEKLYNNFDDSMNENERKEPSKIEIKDNISLSKRNEINENKNKIKEEDIGKENRGKKEDNYMSQKQSIEKNEEKALLPKTKNKKELIIEKEKINYSRNENEGGNFCSNDMPFNNKLGEGNECVIETENFSLFLQIIETDPEIEGKKEYSSNKN
jgi:hypothetical protein